ncbi:MAG: right-handed parallel beta-helix repeat-containing protein [Phycisphaerae bacterium]|nr:right-handed parallel beta-helix repeat-containing protein [Phycisphaerae bacterium]
MMRKISHAMLAALATAVIFTGGAYAGTYYVSTGGDDTADGKSEKAAWRTIAHAARVARAGDTVLVGPGDYGDERVVFANSGKKGKPIVVKGHGGRPVLKNDDGKGAAFQVEGKSYIHVEGFDITGYACPIRFTKGASYGLARGIRGIRPRSGIRITNDAHHCCIDSCYVSDSGWNGIMIYSDPGSMGRWKRKPCTFNTFSNCVVVRGGHSSFDVHTGCPDSYVVGCLAREKGKDYRGGTGACGFYLHNFDIDRMRVIGNAVTACYWGIALTGANDCLMAENTVCGNSRGITLDRSSRWDKAGNPAVPCDKNVIADNIIFDVMLTKNWVGGLRLYGAANNAFMRNYVEKGNRDYYCGRTKSGDSTGNAIADAMKGRESIQVHADGNYTLSYNPGLWPVGTVFRLTDKDNKTVEKKMGPGGVSFGTLTLGTYTLQTIIPGKALPAPQYFRAAALPNIEGGAVIVWADCCTDETGFVLERKLSGQKDFKQIAKLNADTTRYMDKEVGRKKAAYRIRAVRGNEKSAWSNADEVVRYGYWFTNRAGLAVDGYTAFGQVERGDLKTLIVEKAKRVERRANAAEGLSSFALLEAGKPGTAWPKSAGAKGKAEVWLVASRPITATLRWRAGWIRGFVQRKGEYSLELTTAGQAVKSATFNGKTVKTVYNKDKGLVRLDLSGSGAVAIELINE